MNHINAGIIDNYISMMYGFDEFSSQDSSISINEQKLIKIDKCYYYNISLLPYPVYSRFINLLSKEDLLKMTMTSKECYINICRIRGIYSKCILSELFNGFETFFINGIRDTYFSIKIFECKKCPKFPLGWYRGRKMFDYLNFDKTSYFFGRQLSKFDHEIISLLPRNMNFCYIVDESFENSIHDRDMYCAILYIRYSTNERVLDALKYVTKADIVKIWVTIVNDEETLNNKLEEYTKNTSQILDISYMWNKHKFQFINGTRNVVNFETFIDWAKNAGVYQFKI